MSMGSVPNPSSRHTPGDMPPPAKVVRPKKPTVPVVPPPIVVERTSVKQRAGEMLLMMSSVWKSVEEDEYAEVQNMRLLPRIFTPIMDIFLAWGILKTLYQPDGWITGTQFGTMILPMVNTMLPIVIAYRTGKVLYGFRGALFASFAVSSLTVTLPAPPVAPALVYALVSVPALRFVDYLFELVAGIDVGLKKKIRGFDMIVLFLSKTLFLGMAVLAALFVFESGTPSVEWTVTAFNDATEVLLDQWTPLGSILIETGKVLFLGDSLQTSVLTPLATATNTTAGVYYLLQTNPGPGFGILASAFVAGPSQARMAIPFAATIFLFGGVPEAYFPYFYMLPQLIFALIVGGMAGAIVFDVMDAGLTSVSASTSILVLADATPSDAMGGVVAGIVVSALVSFIVGCLLLAWPGAWIRRHTPTLRLPTMKKR